MRPKGSDLDDILVGDIMCRNVLVVSTETSIECVTQMLLTQHISGLPVLNTNGKPVGVISKTDLVREADDRGETAEVERFDPPLDPGFHSTRLTRATAHEIMTPMTFTTTADAPLGRGAALMAYEGVHRLVVVDDSGDVVGLLSALDVMHWYAGSRGYLPQSAGGVPG